MTAPSVRPLTREERDALSADEIVERALEGNERFRSGRRRQRDFAAELSLASAGQSPVAVILGCIDSRAPAEVIFDLGLGDVFNCRIAGNIENPDILGSMEYATKVAGARVIAVVGHSACGAVKGAIDGAELGNLTQLLAKIRPAIAATNYQGKRSADDYGFVDAVARSNVRLTVQRIRAASPVIAGLEEEGALRIVGCFYDVASGAIEILG